MRRIVTLLVLCILLCTAFSGAARAADDYQPRVFTGADGGKLPYRLLTPPVVDPAQRYPLVILLHGAGERGNDNQRQLVHGAAGFTQAGVRSAHPCFVVAPQCPGDRRWCEVDWGDPVPHRTPAEPSVPMALLISLLPTLEQELPIDLDRVYVTGLSMGGFGTWDLVTRLPGTFAAAAPVCGGADDSAAPRLAALPLWVFHGGADPVVRTVRSRSMVAALKQAGSTVVRYTEYPGVGHNAWDMAYADPEFYEWLFSQKRAAAAGTAK